jgi:hypothetical protein
MSQGDHVVKISAEAPPHQKASRLATGDNLVMLRHPIHQSIAIAGGIVLWEISSACICRLELFSLSLSLSLPAIPTSNYAKIVPRRLHDLI